MMKNEGLPTPIPASRRVRTLAVTLLFAMIVSLAVVVPGVAAPAAPTNQDIVVDNLTLSHIDAAEDPQPGQLTTSSVALLKWRWDASNATVKEGDSFTIELPQVFTYCRQATEPIYYDFGNGNKNVSVDLPDVGGIRCPQAAAYAFQKLAGTGLLRRSLGPPVGPAGARRLCAHPGRPRQYSSRRPRLNRP